MKKLLAIVLAAIMLCSMLLMTSCAFVLDTEESDSKTTTKAQTETKAQTQAQTQPQTQNNGNGTGNNGQVENAAECGSGNHGHSADCGSDPQGEEAGNGHGHQNDDHGVPQTLPENGVTITDAAIGIDGFLPQQILIVLQANENIFTADGCIEEAGIHAHEHGIYHEYHKEQQEGQQKQIGSCRFPQHQLAAFCIKNNSFICQGNPPLKNKVTSNSE